MFYDRLIKECERQEKKISPVVESAGGDRGQIKNWKKGGMPNGTFLKKLADYLNVSTDYLLELTDNPTPPPNDFTPDEIAHMEKYRQLTPEGQAAVNNTLDFEYGRKKVSEKLLISELIKMDDNKFSTVAAFEGGIEKLQRDEDLKGISDSLKNNK